MIDVTGLDDLNKIVIINPKGGCGKSTLATNVASSYAQCASPPTLIDCDPHGFSMRWLDKRPADRPPILGVEAYDISDKIARPLGERVRPESSAVVFDLPAVITNEQLHEFIYVADSILIPVMPSAVDVYSATRFIAELLLDQQLDRRDRKLGIVANRVRRNTKSYQMLRRFLTSLKIPVIAELRDSQNFVYAMANGIGLCEMPAYRIRDDIGQLDAILAWLYERREPVRKTLTEEQRQEMVAEVAYQRAEHRGFRGGDPSLDWLEAEREVDATYGDNVDR